MNNQYATSILQHIAANVATALPPRRRRARSDKSRDPVPILRRGSKPTRGRVHHRLFTSSFCLQLPLRRLFF